MIVEEAIRRQRIFNSLEEHLQRIKRTVQGIDPDAEVYLFGSVAENRHTYSSDIDILIVTKMEPGKIHLELWKTGIKDPFEIHVQPSESADLYKGRGKRIKI